MIIGYCRVSSEQQSLDLQLDALKRAGCERVFSDKMSGARTDRPALDDCLKFLQKGDTLVVYKFDRLGRSLKHLVDVVSGLNDRGIDLIVTTMAIDTRTATGKLMFGILASVAEFERSMIRERQAAGIAAAKVRGAKWGPPPKLTPEKLQKALSDRANGIPVATIASSLGVGCSTLYGALQQ